MRTYIALTIFVACVSSVLTTLLVSTTTSARAAGGNVAVITGYEVTQEESTYASVNPGGEEDRFVSCPKHEIATGGGFQLHGLNGASAPSVTASYRLVHGGPTLGGCTSRIRRWDIQPKSAP